MEEKWKDVVGYEGIYKVSNLGNVKSVDRFTNHVGGRQFCAGIKKRPTRKKGYEYLILSKEGRNKNVLVHRVVAEAFIPNPHNKPEVNHINEIRYDNRASNLEWVTRKENKAHGACKLREINTKSKPVYQYTQEGEFVKMFPSISSVKYDGFSAGNVGAYARGSKSYAYGYIWSFEPLFEIEEGKPKYELA